MHRTVQKPLERLDFSGYTYSGVWEADRERCMSQMQSSLCMICF